MRAELHDREPQVVGEGAQWIARAFVVDDWYITAYGPIMDPNGAVIGIIYGAYAAWVQRDLKKLVAYSSVSHMAYVLLGMAAMNSTGINGAVL